MPNQTQLANLQAVVLAAQLSQQHWKIPASVTLAQWIVESTWGTSGLALQCKNYFGIKAVAGQEYGEFNTPEYINGQRAFMAQRFAKYHGQEESFYAHAKLLATLPRYAPAMQQANDYVAFCAELQHCGYSTSPTYAADLLTLIRQNNLTQYDKPACPAGRS